MKIKKLSIPSALRPAAVPALVRYLLRDEASSGKLILGATALALLCANSPLRHIYDSIWQTNLGIGLGSWSLSQDLLHWINEGLMSFFFLVVGLEIKRELVHGELHNARTAILPIGAAVGGMVVPALLYMAITGGTDGFRGWAIPMATDIAFAIGILALLGKRVPASLRLFLLTLAIVDDIGAIIVIAVFYGTGFNPWMLGLAALLSACLLALRKSRLLTVPTFATIGVAIWLSLNAAGVHASIAGALLGLLAPVTGGNLVRPALAERIEKLVIPISTLFVVPLFAFANTGVELSFGSFTGSAVNIAWGIGIGLIVGKAVGIVGTSWILVKTGVSNLPKYATWPKMIGIGLLAGIGFTVSIFVTELAFDGNEQYVIVAKLSVFAASAISAILGLLLLSGKIKTEE